MKEFRFWLSLLLVRLARWVAPRDYADSKVLGKFATHIINSVS